MAQKRQEGGDGEGFVEGVGPREGEMGEDGVMDEGGERVRDWMAEEVELAGGGGGGGGRAVMRRGMGDAGIGVVEGWLRFAPGCAVGGGMWQHFYDRRAISVRIVVLMLSNSDVRPRHLGRHLSLYFGR